MSRSGAVALFAGGLVVYAVASSSRAPPSPSAREPYRAAAVTASIPASPQAEAEPARVFKQLRVSGRDVPLRASPDISASVLDRLAQGLTVAELHRQNDWVKVRHPATLREGWVKASLLSEDRPGDQGRPPPTITTPSTQSLLTATGIIQRLLAESRASYPHNCACPEDRDRAGRRCGARSAYSRPSGYAPLCYPTDVTADMVAAYRERVGQGR
jgi:hypothetical protein